MGRVERYVAGARLGENRIRPVVFVERLEDNDLIARIADGKERGDHRLGRAATDRHFGSRIKRQALESLILPRDGLAQALGAPGDRILIDVGGDRLARGFLDLVGRTEIGKSLSEVHRIVANRLAGHLPDDRLGKKPGPLAHSGFLKNSFCHAAFSLT